MTNFGDNLPPGVTESDLPGNRPEDEEWDAWFEENATAIDTEQTRFELELEPHADIDEVESEILDRFSYPADAENALTL